MPPHGSWQAREIGQGPRFERHLARAAKRLFSIPASENRWGPRFRGEMSNSAWVSATSRATRSTQGPLTWTYIIAGHNRDFRRRSIIRSWSGGCVS